MDARVFGSFIAALRKEKGMTQAELARELSVTDKAVSRWERENRKPQLAMLGKFYSFCLRNGIELETKNEER